jgi:hypothetical protein
VICFSANKHCPTTISSCSSQMLLLVVQCIGFTFHIPCNVQLAFLAKDLATWVEALVFHISRKDQLSVLYSIYNHRWISECIIYLVWHNKWSGICCQHSIRTSLHDLAQEWHWFGLLLWLLAWTYVVSTTRNTWVLPFCLWVLVPWMQHRQWYMTCIMYMVTTIPSPTRVCSLSWVRKEVYHGR